MRSKMFRRFLLINSICISFSMLLGGCTKQKAEYKLDKKFVYNSIQESEKEKSDSKDEEVPEMEEDSIGQDLEDGSVVFHENGDGTVTVTDQQTSADDVLPDMPLTDLTDTVATEEPVTEGETDETEKSKDADKADKDGEAADKDDDSDEDSSEEADNGGKKKPTDHGNVGDDPNVPTTEADGDKGGKDGTTKPGQTTDNGKDGDDGNDGDSGDKGDNPNKQGTSTSTDAGRGDGSGADGDGNPGGSKPGNNGNGQGDSGNGGDGDGGNNGDGDKGGIGSGDGDKGGKDDGDAKKDPEKAVDIWYEGVLGNYIWGEKPDTSGIKVFAEFEDGSKKEIDDYTVNMDYPERYVADVSEQYPKTYDVGVRNATISYQNVQVLCPYNLVALYLGIYGNCYYGNCTDPTGHNAWTGNKVKDHPEWGQYYICSQAHDCYYWKLNSKGQMHTITATFGIDYVPVYYDYVYTQEDLLSDDYYMNVKYDLSKCEIFGGPITLYKDSVITDSYYCRAGLSQMYCIHEDRAKIYQLGKDDPW